MTRGLGGEPGARLIPRAGLLRLWNDLAILSRGSKIVLKVANDSLIKGYGRADFSSRSRSSEQEEKLSWRES